MLALTNARLFDGRTMLPGRHSVFLEGNRIAAIDEVSGVELKKRIDLNGMTLMPGLISSHLHPDFYKYTFENFARGEQLGKERPPGVLTIIGVRTCRVLLESGFTGYIGAACSNYIDPQLKMAIEEGFIPGPRILPCSHHVGTTSDANATRNWWQSFREPGIDLFGNGPNEMRKLVREEIRCGAQVIKVFASTSHAVLTDRGRRNMSRDELAAVADTAHERGVKVRAHVCYKELILEAIELGVDIIDHADEIDDEVIEAMVKAGSFWVPSLLFLKVGLDQKWSDSDGAIMNGYKALCRYLPVAHKAGIRILLGDDFGVGAGPLAHEVGSYAAELLAYAEVEGVSSADILTWGTRNGGELLGKPGMAVGVVKPGALADLIVVDGDPVADLSVFARPEQTLKAVIRDGAMVIDRLRSAGSRTPAE